MKLATKLCKGLFRLYLENIRRGGFIEGGYFIKTTSVCPVTCPSLLTSETTSFYDTNLHK